MSGFDRFGQLSAGFGTTAQQPPQQDLLLTFILSRGLGTDVS
jgi:hypothetical protein